MSDTQSDGIVWIYKNQRYRLLGEFEQGNGDTFRRVLHWQTTCPVCDHGFVAVTLRTFDSPTRRCERCRKPGRFAAP